MSPRLANTHPTYQPSRVGEWSVDTVAIKEFMFKKAEKVALRTARYTLGRAKEHAPVRKIFVGTTYGAHPLFSPYSSPKGQAKRPMMHRALDAGRPVSGHANSLMPVFAKGKTRVTGDFRRIEIDKSYVGHGASVANKIELMKVPTSRSTLHRGDFKGIVVASSSPVKAGKLEAPGTFKLSVEGRYELKSGRAIYRSKEPGDSEAQDRVGGRLRGEIHIEGPLREGDMVWVQIVSPTAYARHMEYGTVHNRPFPYLRPALHESRGRLKQFARREFRRILVGPEGVSDG